jgi:hypothetical protein
VTARPGTAEQSVACAINRAAAGRPVPGNKVDLLIDGPDTYATMLELIADAARWIHFENYIIRSDAAGRRFADALIERARAGIRCARAVRRNRLALHLAGALARSASGRRGGPRVPPDPPAQPGHQLLPQPSQAGRGRRSPLGHRWSLHRLRMDRREPPRRPAVARHGRADRGPGPAVLDQAFAGPGGSPADGYRTTTSPAG